MRARSGFRDAEVARRLGLAQSRYANYVNGNREPDLATFARICRALATTPNEILGFGSHGAQSAEAEAERRRALAAIERWSGPRLGSPLSCLRPSLPNRMSSKRSELGFQNPGLNRLLGIRPEI
ncbi:MAG: helix-turn-helix transcriptional regulator [Acetobacteraceae bacterium]|nr:helix-turn-helix transcriptional regulator [Acetobacteraceae bacterium]